MMGGFRRTLFLVFVLGLLAGFACGDPAGPELRYWAICEAPGLGYIHEGPFDTWREADDAAYEAQQFYGAFGVYLECEIRTQEQRPIMGVTL